MEIHETKSHLNSGGGARVFLCVFPFPHLLLSSFSLREKSASSHRAAVDSSCLVCGWMDELNEG